MSANHVSTNVIKLTSTSVSLCVSRHVSISNWSNMSTKLQQNEQSIIQLKRDSCGIDSLEIN